MSCFKEIFYCRICQSNKLTEVIDLGLHALSGCFPKKNESDPQKSPLKLVRCLECDLVQLKHSVIPQLMFTDTYGYRSNINQTMRLHLKELVENVYKRVCLNKDDIVLDIGCNDGTLLKEYPSYLTRVGIDPVSNKFQSQYPDDLIVIADFFSKKTFQKFNINGKKAKIITSISMFYDLEDPVQFSKDVASCLDDNGLWVLEQSYLPDMLENHSFDTICHEHLEYYSLKQIEYIIKEAKLRVLDLEFNKINGGSMRVYVTPMCSSLRTNDKMIESVRGRENKLNLSKPDTYKIFKDKCEALALTIKDLISNEVSKNKTFHIYGASTKGNTILQFCGLDSSLIQVAADRSPEKWGCRTPATNIPIVSEEESRILKPDYYLVLPWHFREEIIQRESLFLNNGGKLIFTMPKFEIVDRLYFREQLNEV